MDKNELMRKAYSNAVDNMVIAGLDNEVCYIVIRESMKLYLKGHGVDVPESEVVSFIKDQVNILHHALSDFEVSGNTFTSIGAK